MIKKICNRKWYARIFLFIFTLGVLAPSFHDIPNQNQKEDYDFDVNTNIQNKNNSSELENIADPKVGGIANCPELANEMAPIVINMEQFSSIASALNGKDYGNIRVAYYSSDYEWKKISFQIDEIGNPYRWEDHYDPSAQEDPNPQLYQFKGYIPFGDPYGRGYDENPGKIDGTDELIFYAQNGRRVSNNLWMDPETFSHRIHLIMRRKLLIILICIFTILPQIWV